VRIDTGLTTTLEAYCERVTTQLNNSHLANTGDVGIMNGVVGARSCETDSSHILISCRPLNDRRSVTTLSP